MYCVILVFLLRLRYGHLTPRLLIRTAVWYVSKPTQTRGRSRDKYVQYKGQIFPGAGAGADLYRAVGDLSWRAVY